MASSIYIFPGGLSTSGGGLAVGGNPVPVVVSSGRVVAQTAAVASIATFANGATDASYEVGGNFLATVSTTYSIDMTVSYTDESNTARVIKLNMLTVAGAVTNSAPMTAANGPLFQAHPIEIRVKASTSITIGTVGTFTTVTYNAEGIIKKLN